MPSLGAFMVAYAWKYGCTVEQGKRMYDEYIRRGMKQAMFAIIREYQEKAWADAAYINR